MIIGHIQGATCVYGGEGCNPLPVRKAVTADGQTTLTSAWFPTPDEMQKMLEGAPIYLSIVSPNHPPVLLTVGENGL